MISPGASSAVMSMTRWLSTPLRVVDLALCLCERVGVAVDQQQPCPFLGEPDRGRPPVADRLASLLAGANDHCDLLVQTSAHGVLSP